MGRIRRLCNKSYNLINKLKHDALTLVATMNRDKKSVRGYSVGMDQATSDLLTRTGPGTAMGNLMRRYWVPILASSEIQEPDGPQQRVQILGERLLAFRDTEGQLRKSGRGLLDNK